MLNLLQMTRQRRLASERSPRPIFVPERGFRAGGIAPAVTEARRNPRVIDGESRTSYPRPMSVKSTLYDRDFFAWSNEQAALLRAGKLGEADIGHIAEEIESMGKTEKRELISRLTILLLHLLKWRFQAAKRAPSWEASVRVQRNRLADHLDGQSKPQAAAAEGARLGLPQRYAGGGGGDRNSRMDLSQGLSLDGR